MQILKNSATTKLVLHLLTIGFHKNIKICCPFQCTTASCTNPILSTRILPICWKTIISSHVRFYHLHVSLKLIFTLIDTLIFMLINAICQAPICPKLDPLTNHSQKVRVSMMSESEPYMVTHGLM